MAMPRRWHRGRTGRRGAAVLLLCCASLVLSACTDAESALARGDRLWADSAWTEALAEYRLAYDGNRSDQALARVAHAYAATGQFERAREHYDLLVARAPEYTDQAVFDYLRLAHRAEERSDRYGMAAAMEAALALRPGLPVTGMAAPLARFYSRSGDVERAVVFYERALAEATPDSVPVLLFDYGQLMEQHGRCAEAMELFNAFRAREPRGERADQARWNVGNCAFQLGRQARQDGNGETALSYLQVVIDLGVPPNLVEQAWFERGETLAAMGRGEEALDAFVRVLESVRSTTSPLAERARQRINELRFGSLPARPGMDPPP